MNRLGVIGWPVAHSRSPALQNAALAAAGLADDWHYQLLPIPPELFEETVLALPGDGFRGVNVTLPHKERALALATASGGQISERARAIGAANTLVFEADGRIAADNTDAVALVASAPTELRGRTALILGAGGSARAALWALRDAGAAEVRVWNRNPERAAALCAELGGTPAATIEAADLLVNCTPVGLNVGDSLAMLPLPAAGVSAFGAVADYVYNVAGTPLAAAARAAGIPLVDGLELLAAQGIPAFELFTGVHAGPEVVAAVRAALGLCSAP